MPKTGRFEEFDQTFDEGFAYVGLWHSLTHAKDEAQKEEIRNVMRELREASRFLKDVLPDDVCDLSPYLVLLASRSQRRFMVQRERNLPPQPQPRLSYGFAEVAV